MVDNLAQALTTGPPMGRVLALAVRPKGAEAPFAVECVEAIQGEGLLGDKYADTLSPRHLLLASRHVYSNLGLPFNTLRENLLVDFDTADLQSGTVLQVGCKTRIWITFQCEACGQLNRVYPTLSRDLGKNRGVLARILTGGFITQGDAIYATETVLPAWADDWRHRISQILCKVPEGQVIEYLQLARLAGVPSSYCRVFPRFIRTLGSAAACRAVSLQDKSGMPRWMGDTLFDSQLG
jgi:hypothetical protein